MTGESREAAVIRDALERGRGREFYWQETETWTPALAALDALVAHRDGLEQELAGATRQGLGDERQWYLDKQADKKRIAELERERDEALDELRDYSEGTLSPDDTLADGITWLMREEQRWRSELVAAEARVAALTEALRKVKEFASDPFASEIVALRACLLEANEALGLPGPEDSPLRQMAREVLKEMRAEPESGVELIRKERQRQFEEENWTPEHDDDHREDEIAIAAACYAMPEGTRMDFGLEEWWPWQKSWWKPGNRIRELVKAGALIAAEIDRLQRAEAATEKTP